MTLQQRTLQQRMNAYLRERDVSPTYAEQAGWRVADDALAQNMGFYPALPGIVIPYLHPLNHEPHPSVMRLRYFDPPIIKGKPHRYSQPRKSGVEAYFDPNVDWVSVFPDTRIEIVITEGEAKALHINQHSKELGGRFAVALGGVWSFLEPQRGDNAPRDLTSWLRAMRELGRGRTYNIAFDSDIAENLNLLSAAELLKGLLSR